MFFATLFLTTALTAATRDKNTYSIITCNIRITGLEADSAYTERIWDNRKDFCLKTILKRKPDIICMQEGIYDSYAYFKEKLQGKYTAFGFEGPEMDPYTEGYHFIGKNPIFFNSKRLEMTGAGTYWLSETPLKGGSESWGTKRARHCNWVRLRDKSTGKEFRVLDIHLDHISDSARKEQIKLVLDECSQYAEDFPQIICGDFNSGVKNAPIVYIHSQEGWKEMYEAVHGEGEHGRTAHGFKGDKAKPGRRIDFIFYRGPIEVLDADYVKDHVGDLYPSDHYFIHADFRLK